jgi:hypothetical protein
VKAQLLQLLKLLQQTTQQRPESVLVLGNASVSGNRGTRMASVAVGVFLSRLHRRIDCFNSRNNRSNNWQHRSIIRGGVPLLAGG